MIKWRGSGKGREQIGFLLDKGNLKALREGKPIHILKEEMGLPFDIIIGYTKDLVESMKLLRESGMITPETIIHDSRQRKKQ